MWFYLLLQPRAGECSIPSGGRKQNLWDPAVNWQPTLSLCSLSSTTWCYLLGVDPDTLYLRSSVPLLAVNCLRVCQLLTLHSYINDLILHLLNTSGFIRSSSGSKATWKFTFWRNKWTSMFEKKKKQTKNYIYEESRLKLCCLSNHMNKLSKEVCLLESWDTHISRAFLSSVLLSYFQ